MQSVSPDIGQSVLTELQCPACKEYMEPPITFCLGGHNICSNCRPTVSRCPTCKKGFLKTRNVSLENLSLQIKFPCSYSQYGCKDTFPYSAIREHKAKCGYRPERCPVDYLMLKMICTWTGIANRVKQHLQTAHSDLCEDYNHDYYLEFSSSHASNYQYKFVFAYNEIFCCRLLIEREILYVILHYIGPAENDMKYRYIVLVKNEEDTESFAVTHLARRFTVPDDNLFFPKNCLKLHRDVTDRFRNEKDKLVVLMEILKVDE
jgi:hypothetical protein